MHNTHTPNWFNYMQSDAERGIVGKDLEVVQTLSLLANARTVCKNALAARISIVLQEDWHVRGP